jgi:hypothetical protein
MKSFKETVDDPRIGEVKRFLVDDPLRYEILSKEELIERFNFVHKNKYDYSQVNYVNSKEKIEIVCSKHGVFTQRANSHLNGGGCPECYESKGEIEIKLFLEKYNIEFQKQKRFKECRNIRPLPFDFYLPKQNFCIEYDGEQHFREKGGYHKKENSFKESVKRDLIKDQFCSGVNGRPQLFRINFLQLNEIENILKVILKK